MFRFMQNYTNKPVNAMKTAEVAMVQGMGVVVEDDTVKLPTEATAKDIFIVTKERIPTGLDSIQGDIPDYDERFENIEKGDFVVLIKPTTPERFFTDQFTGSLSKGDYVVVGVDGKFVKANSDAESNLKVVNPAYVDCGKHTGVLIEVVDWATV